MGYELTTRLDLQAQGCRFRFLEGVLGLLSEEEFSCVQVTEYEPSGDRTRLLQGTGEVLSVAPQLLRNRPSRPCASAVGCFLGSSTTGSRVRFSVVSHGPGYFERWEVSDKVRHDVEVSLDVMDPEWHGHRLGIGPAGVEAFAFDLMQQVCSVGEVRRAHSLQEQLVSNPLALTLAFHDRPSGFCTDLRDVVTLAYWGGAGHYTDERKDDAPLIHERPDHILFCDRSRQEIDRIKARLLALQPRVEASGVPADTTREVIEAAAAASGRYVTFITPDGGFGVRQREPAFNGFLDDFYLDLLDRVLAQKCVV